MANQLVAVVSFYIKMLNHRMSSFDGFSDVCVVYPLGMRGTT